MAQDLASSLAEDMFNRIQASSALGLGGVLIMVYPHVATTPWPVCLGWSAAAATVLLCRILHSRVALSRLKSGRGKGFHVEFETALSALVGIGWGSALYVFDTGAMDQAFYIRLMILSGTMAFVLSSVSVYIRVLLAYGLATGVTVVAFIASHAYVEPRDVLIECILLYATMLVGLGISANRRIRSATADHLAVVALTGELNKALASERDLREAYGRVAITDELTGILNRRGILDVLATELARCQRFASTLAVFVIDIDHFKRINDSYGHAVGDATLRAVVAALRQGLRDSDVPGRIGGEEFLIVLPVLESKGALIAAERLRACVEESEAMLASGPGRVTVSIGIGLYRAGDDGERLLARADNALYAAKGAGRNRVELEARDPAVE